MLLAIDIGNTNVTFGVFQGSELKGRWRIATDTAKLADEYAAVIMDLLGLRAVSRADIESAVMASVVPSLTSVFEEACERHFDITPLKVGAGVKTGLKVLYEDPREVGADRIADAVAGLRLHAPPLIIVDVGTATVFDAISRDGDYLGGAISPGIGVAAEALAQKAAMLRSVDLRAPKLAIGRNTTAAMQSGIIFGFTGLVEEMIRRFKLEVGEDAWVIGTGGWAGLLAQVSACFDHVDIDLTLNGLQYLYEMNGVGSRELE